MALNVPSMQDLLGAGVHFGHKVSRGNPRMKQYIYGARDGVHIIDLAFSEEKLKEATQAAYDLGKNGKTLLIVGTKKQSREVVETLAKEVGAPFISVRWVGGLLTNIEEIKKNFKRLTTLKEQQLKGELSRYTKKEQLLMARKLTKFEEELGGVASLESVPDAMFIVDAVADNTAIKEARKMNLIVLGLCDTNADPNWFDYPVPANDDGIKSINLICETVIRAYGEGKKSIKVEGEPVKEEKKTVEKKADKKEEVVAEVVIEELPKAVAEETAIIEEQVEKEIVKESDRKVE